MNLKYRLISLKYNIKRYLQRLFYGYSHEDIWNGSAFIAKRIIRVAKVIKKNAYACPSKRPLEYYINEDGYEDVVFLTLEEWKGILEDIIIGFESYITISNGDVMKDSGMEISDFHTIPTDRPEYVELVFDDPINNSRYRAVEKVKTSILREKYDKALKLFNLYFEDLYV